jgi:hypothetical protein
MSNQIWRYSKYESIKFEATFHIIGNCGDFWKKKIRIFFLDFFSKNKNKNTTGDHW